MLHLSLGCDPLPLFRLDTGAVGAIMWKNPQWGEKGRNAMILETIHLGDLYPFLREKGRDPVLRAYLPEIPIIVDSACCAGVTPESHRTALAAMRACQIIIENEPSI